MERLKVGRNDACPCGSGKKYKNCCLPLDEIMDPAAEAFDQYNQMITGVKLKLDQQYGAQIKKVRKDLQSRFLRFAVDNELSQDSESLFSDWLWFDLSNSSENTFAFDYINEHRELIPAKLLECTGSLAMSYVSVYEPIKTQDKQLLVKDLFMGWELEVLLKEPLDIDIDNKELLMFGRVIILPEAKLFSGMVLLIENESGEKDFIVKHVNYLKELNAENNMVTLFKFNADILYGLFNHAYHRIRPVINDIRKTSISREEKALLLQKLDNSDDFSFVHAVNGIHWYEAVNSKNYCRIAFDDESVLSCSSILDDFLLMQSIVPDELKENRWELVSSQYISRPPAPDMAESWYKVLMDRETERWLHTPHHELDDKTPMDIMNDKDGKDKLLAILDSFESQCEENNESLKLINYMRMRINA